MFDAARVYIAGPMTGIEAHNFPAFYEAEERLLAAGFDPVNPARMDEELDGFRPTEDTAMPHEHYMERDLPAVLDCDAVAVLPGWERSRGARNEVGVALMVGREIIDARTFEPVDARPILVTTRKGGWIV